LKIPQDSSKSVRGCSSMPVSPSRSIR